jgi:hypothetical protein
MVKSHIRYRCQSHSRSVPSTYLTGQKHITCWERCDIVWHLYLGKSSMMEEFFALSFPVMLALLQTFNPKSIHPDVASQVFITQAKAYVGSHGGLQWM